MFSILQDKPRYLGAEISDHLQLSVVTGIVQGQPPVNLSVHIQPLFLIIILFYIYLDSTYNTDMILYAMASQNYLVVNQLLNLIQVSVLYCPGQVAHLCLLESYFSKTKVISGFAVQHR